MIQNYDDAQRPRGEMRYPSDISPVRYILTREGNTKEMRFKFSKKDRREEIRDGSDKSKRQTPTYFNFYGNTFLTF